MGMGLATLLLWLMAAAEARDTAALRKMPDIARYPACQGDDDCKKLEDHACFQYFCYPWTERGRTATAGQTPHPYNSCRKSKDCGANFKGECFRHGNVRKVFYGICVESVDECDVHEECNGKGGRCCNRHCCTEEYFQGIMDIPCVSDFGCQDLLLGEHCCIDIMGSLEFNSSKPNWGKKCCSNQRGPVVELPRNISPRDKDKLNGQILRMDHLQSTICKSFDYNFMLGFSACSSFATTTTTTMIPATRKNTASKKTASDNQRSEFATDGNRGSSLSTGTESQKRAGQLAVALFSFLLSRAL